MVCRGRLAVVAMELQGDDGRQLQKVKNESGRRNVCAGVVAGILYFRDFFCRADVGMSAGKMWCGISG